MHLVELEHLVVEEGRGGGGAVLGAAGPALRGAQLLLQPQSRPAAGPRRRRPRLQRPRVLRMRGR